MNGADTSESLGAETTDPAEKDRQDALRSRASTLPSFQVSERALCDFELIATGAFTPLTRFMGRSDYSRVLEEMRLASGELFPIPITLQLPDGFDVALDSEVALRDSHNDLLAILRVEEIYERSSDEGRIVTGTKDLAHPLLAEMERWGSRNVSGPLEVIALPSHFDFRELRRTPAETRLALAKLGAGNVVAFQTRNPLHRAHEALTKRAMELVDGTLLLHPVVGMTKPGDVDHFTRVRAYRLLAEHYYPHDRIVLSLLPLAMRMAGPREALWHALIRRNYGATHFIVGRDHASPGRDSSGQPYYDPYAAQELTLKHQEELGISILPFEEMAYLPDEDRYEEISKIAPGTRTATISGTQVREEYLNRGERLPGWFTRPEIAELLASAYPPRYQQGVCIWFTGLSGAGKSATAEILTALLLQYGRAATVLDGDVVRTNLSKGLGFSREDRDANILRIGFVAAEVVRHGGVAICAAVSPYRSTRDEVRKMFPPGQFIEVFVDTPLEVCESRDSKGMYAKARRGEIRNFTGIDDPYEEPLNPELRLETTRDSAEKNARRVASLLETNGFVR